MLFFLTGGLGLVIIAPLFMAVLKDSPEETPVQPAAPRPERAPRTRLTLSSLGGPRFILIVFSYLTNGMLFWGVTLWLPLAVVSLGFHGLMQGFGAGLPYLAAVILAIPMTVISDRTGRRSVVAAAGLLVAGVLLILLPEVASPVGRLVLIICAVGFYASSFTPNIWAIIQSTVEPSAIGPAAGIVNGIGSGGGGILAGWLVGLLHGSTGSYVPGFAVLGILGVLGGVSLAVYGRLARPVIAVTPAQAHATREGRAEPAEHRARRRDPPAQRHLRPGDQPRRSPGAAQGPADDGDLRD